MGVNETRGIALIEWRAKKAYRDKVRAHIAQCTDPNCDHDKVVALSIPTAYIPFDEIFGD